MKQRIITGVVLGLVALLAILTFPIYLFELVIGCVLLLAAYEWAGSFLGLKGILKYFYVLCIAIGALIIWSFPDTFQWVLVIAALWWLIALLLIKLYSSGMINKIHQVLKIMMGFLVILPAWVGVIILKSENEMLLIFVLLAVVLADSGAYFIGRLYGKHKLAPSISPKKTWEGLLGGICFSVVGSLVFSFALNLSSLHELGVFVSLAVLIVLFALLGDLFESMIKREVGIKDSGNILPGHGGILDRLDSVFVALPLFIFCANLFGFSI
ncbi:phosphatidate cytidylyltransferase [Thiotrichales bacterium 19S9-12]|nr:phosphatidate cytidylyltransferase [Thiotrichales bacterium 19S9-11]MCF6811279.1 phosphatidate cytidylyltransferase [Thiotrichales bacterium 19S9-12]